MNVLLCFSTEYLVWKLGFASYLEIWTIVHWRSWILGSTLDFQGPHWNPTIHTTILGSTLESKNKHWNTSIHIGIPGSILKTQNSHWNPRVWTGFQGPFIYQESLIYKSRFLSNNTSMVFRQELLTKQIEK